MDVNMDRKRVRSVNYTHEETRRLLSMVSEKKTIIENKKSDANTWNEKINAWKAIETKFNCNGRGPFRSAKNLRLKYEAIKRDMRKKFNAVRAEHYKNGDTSTAPTLTPIESKIQEMIRLSVEGGESTCDSDPLDVNNDAINVNIELENMAVNDKSMIEELDITYEQEETDTDNAAVNNNPIKVEIEAADEAEDTDSDNAAVNHNSVTNKWPTWKPPPASLRTKKHPALSRPQTKRPFDKLAEAKIELAELQKKLLEEEMTEKSLKKEMLQLEMQHKKEMFQLEKEQMMLKKALLKIELETLTKKFA